MQRLAKGVAEGALLCLLAFVVHRAVGWVQAYTARIGESPRIAVGSTMFVPEYGFEKGQATLVVITSPKCRYSKQNKEFHEKLIKVVAQQPARKVLLLLPIMAESDEYARSLAPPGVEVRQTNLSRVGAIGTPTVLLVDEQARVKALWQGLLPENAQSVVLARLSSDDHIITKPSGTIADQVAPARLPEYGKMALILDVRTREEFQISHRQGAINIPVDELIVRANLQLPQRRSIVLDCAHALSTWCEAAQETLVHLKFEDLKLLDQGINERYCQVESLE